MNPENPVTLNEVMKMMGDDWRRDITNDFIRTGYFSKHITFHSLKNPYTGGSGLRHRFTRLQRTAPVTGRLINQDYTPMKVDTITEQVDVKQWGGKFELDRILADAGTLEPEVYLQMSQLAQSCSYYFDQQCIIGNSLADPREFDGILRIAQVYNRIHKPEFPSGNRTVNLFDTLKYELNGLRRPSSVQESYRDFLFAMDEWLSSFDRKPTFLMGNARMMACLRQVAREVGVYQTHTNEWGESVSTYDGIDLITTSYKVEQSIVEKDLSIQREEILPTDKDTGLSVLIAGRFGRDAIYGICPAIGTVIRSWYPEYGGNNVKPVQEAGVEMSAAMVVNKLESIGVLTGLKVAFTDSETTAREEYWQSINNRTIDVTVKNMPPLPESITKNSDANPVITKMKE